MAGPNVYRIHPAIGIARLGDAGADQFFIGPERPNQSGAGDPAIGTMAPPYKTGGRIKRQAARFRIYEYVDKGGRYEMSREINLDEKDVVELTWTAHLANRKASFFIFDGLAGSPLLKKQPKPQRRNSKIVDRAKLELDPLPRSIKGRSTAKVEFRKAGNASERWPVPAPVPKIEYLGELRTDDKGRLIVIGGEGLVGQQPGAPAISNYANNDGWFDDTCDGPVSAKLRLKNAAGGVAEVKVMPAWVLVGPPDFAPDTVPQVSLYQTLLDAAVRGVAIPPKDALYLTGDLRRLPAMAKDLAGGGTSFASYKPDFDLDILPILRAAVQATFVFKAAQRAHGTIGSQDPKSAWDALSDPGQPNAMRQFLFSRLRKPNTGGTPAEDMPRLLGDDPYDKFKTGLQRLFLTVTQYAAMEQWSKGNFTKTAGGPAFLYEGAPHPALTPHGLDRAALENVSGGGFFPGIEVGWQIRDPRLYLEPFRLRPGGQSFYGFDKPGSPLIAGHFSRQMALPWTADFLQCKMELDVGKEWGWWPANRPDVAYPDATEAKNRGTVQAWTRSNSGPPAGWGAVPDYTQMIAHWTKFGFVVRQPGNLYVETERGALP